MKLTVRNLGAEERIRGGGAKSSEADLKVNAEKPKAKINVKFPVASQASFNAAK